MGLPSWLGGGPKKPAAPLAAPAPTGASLLAPPPALPANALATTGGFAATNAARRQRRIATAGAAPSVASMASTTKATPKKLVDAGRAAMGAY